MFSAHHFDENRPIETEIPVIIAYDSDILHYESLLPKGKTDIPKCIALVKAIQSNTSSQNQGIATMENNTSSQIQCVAAFIHII